MVNLSFGGPEALTQGFNWVFLLELIVVVIVVVFLLFFFNRILGFVVSYIIRTYTWHRHKAYFHVEAIQLSFLAGRLLFKNFHYQSSNQSIHVLKGHITWRYWLRRTRVRANTKVKESTNAKLPCRIFLELDGVEWFIYNRTPAYDAILSIAGDQRERTSHENGGIGRTDTKRSSAERTSEASLKPQESAAPPPKKNTADLDETGNWIHFLPMQVVAKKGAIIVGNTNTPSIVVAQFVEADLSIDAAESRSKFDLYKMVYDCNFTHPTIQIKMNIDYKEPLLARASHVMEDARARVPTRTVPSVWRTVRDLIPFFQESSESLAQPQTPRPESGGKEEKPWAGLARYSVGADEDASAVPDTESDPLLQPTDVTEYAKVTTVLDSTELFMSFYYDVPGLVPPIQKQLPSDEMHIGNGDLSPEWGMDIEVTGGTITYGPWADRQRRILQEMFFPGTYEDSSVAPPLNTGDVRVFAYFKVVMEFKENVVFKIPTREKSKDWRYSAQYLRSSIDQRVTTRPFGWIELKASSESTITYHMGLTPRQDGWTNFLNLELKQLRITTSINYGIFMEAEGVRIQCDLSNPLLWEGVHNWIFNITVFRPSIFLLRDHITLFTDCGSDWTSAPVDYATWIPYIYTLNVNFIDFSLFLNVNDGNIISSPSELNDNSYVTFRGPKISGKVTVPSDKISPVEHSVQFEWQSPSMNLTVHAPLWNTLSVLLAQQEVGKLRKFEMSGSYTYPSDVSRNNIETLDMRVSASYVCVIYYGFLLRYFFNVRNNYFGDHTHFVTLEEYQREAKLPGKGIGYGGQRPPIENVLDVIAEIEVSQGALILPSRLYEASEAVRLHFDLLEADVRFMDYYMDLQVNITPVSCFHHYHESMEEIFDDLADKKSQAFIDGLTVHAHRILGKPPSNPAYICSWDFDVGMITGETTISFIQAMNCAIDSFVYHLVDVENALPDITPPDRDITFLRGNAAGATLRIPVDKHEVRIQLGPTTLGTDDRTSLLRSSRQTVNIQSFAAQILHGEKVVASFSTAVRMTILGRRQDLHDHGPKQAKHVRENDLPSKRVWYLYSKRRGYAQEALDTFEIDLPPFPKERVDTIHSRKYSPKCILTKGRHSVPEVHFASAFLSPGYGILSSSGNNIRPPTPHYKEDTPMLHSSYNDLIATHVDNLPSGQKTFIIEFSMDTTVSLNMEVIDALRILIEAWETQDPVAATDEFQQQMVEEVMAGQRDRSAVAFAQLIVPQVKVSIEDDDGFGIFFDVADLAPQLRSVHYKANLADQDSGMSPESSISIIASLSRLDVTVYQMNSPRQDTFPTPAPQKQDLGVISLQDLDVSLWQGYKTVASVSLGDIEGNVSANEIGTISGAFDKWVTQIKEFSSAVDTMSQRRLVKARHLIAAIVLAGDKYRISNDPPFLTRPSHVLRISKNILRTDDSWKISARIRHIARALPPDVKSEIQQQFLSSTECTLESMGGVMEILSRWRSWEISNIQGSYFYNWLTGMTNSKPKAPIDKPIDGVVALKRVLGHLNVGDGRENSVDVRNVMVSCTERPEGASTIKTTTVIGVDVTCETFSVVTETEAFELLQVTKGQSVKKEHANGNLSPSVARSSPSPSIFEMRGGILFQQAEFSGRLANLGVMLGAQNLRVSGFSQLRRTDEVESPSFSASFDQLSFSILEEPASELAAATLNLEHLSAQMVSLEQRPGIAASLVSVKLQLLKPFPWLIEHLAATNDIIKKHFSAPLEAIPAHQISIKKPNLPTVTLRVHRILLEAWLVPETILLSLDSGGFQAVMGELVDSKQWFFLDITPATFSLHRVSENVGKIAEIATPFLAIKTVVHWSKDLCRIDPDIQVGTFPISVTSLAAAFQAIGSDEVVAHISECHKALEMAQSGSSEPTSDPPVSSPKPSSLPKLSYRVHSIWESVEIVADSPDTKILFECMDIYASVSNRFSTAGESARTLFTAGSQRTSLSLISAEDPNDKTSVLDLHWEAGNSVHSNQANNALYRLYLLTNMFTITLCPESVARAAKATSHILQDIERLQIPQTLHNLKLRSDETDASDQNEDSADEDEDPFRALKNLDAVRVALSQIKIKWLVDGPSEASHGFTFQCKNVDASVLDMASRGRFVIQDGEVELNYRGSNLSSNYARLPKLDFNVRRRMEDDGWQLQMDAHGDTVQVNFTPSCLESGHAVLESISLAAASLRLHFPSTPTAPSANPSAAHSLLQQTKRLKAVVTTIDFSGAKINAQYDVGTKPDAYMSKYLVSGDGCDVGSMQIPGLALRSRYSRKPRHVFHAEVCILESTNRLSPQIKPFLHEFLHRLESVMSGRKSSWGETYITQVSTETLPSTASILGDLKFSVGLRIQSQELTLTCDPFAKVDAKVGVNQIYATLVNSKAADQNHAFAMTVTVSGAHASLQHHYSGIASANIKLDDLHLSLFNNDHISSTEPGIAAILKSSAFDISLNARQGQDFLIFNSLWLEGPPSNPIEELGQKRLSNPISMQQLHKVAAAPPAFPINVTIEIDKIKFALDLGQSIGTTDLELHSLRVSNRKCSEFHHCIFVRMESAEAESKGRFSGYMKANNLAAQTAIYFQSDQVILAPLVQIDVGLGYVEFRASFEYHVFLIGDSANLRFTIYNRRILGAEDLWCDRLAFVGNSELIQLYATAEGPALVLSLYKAIIQLKEEKERSRAKELASFTKADHYLTVPNPSNPSSPVEDTPKQSLIFASRVDMEMSIKLSKINVGIFKAALNDSPVFRLNISNIRALFSQTVSRGPLENKLDLSIGTLGVALSPLKRMGGQELGEMHVEKWIKHVSTMRGGVILAVPETEGSMWTRQKEGSDTVEHIFKSKLDGKVDIGWNYGSVMYVQELWKTFEMKMKQGEEARVTHLTKNEEKEISQAVEVETFESKSSSASPDLYTATVESRKYTYVALEPAIIETPQLRQMGEATPPMEWIGVNRMRLPAFTHQAIIVPLQRVSRRVENLYNLTLQGGRK